MYYVYILKSRKDTKRYIGMSTNLERRIYEHNSGKVKSTANRKPMELIYYEKYENKKEATQREKFFKTGKGREYLNKNEK